MKSASPSYNTTAATIQSPRTGWNDYWLYLRTFLHSGWKVASLAPSSRWTARAMIREIAFDPGETIIELGAGTGAVTAELLQAAGTACRPLIVERDPDFCERLKQRFPAADIIAGDALQLEQLLASRGIQQLHHVICTLPLNWLAAAERRKLLSLVQQRLRPGGTFRQLTHLPGWQRSLLGEFFASVEYRFVWRNFPPAGCYLCRKA